VTFKPPPGWVPAWVDKARLCFELCLSDTGVDDWVKYGVLPPPRKLRGKLMWKWKEVEARLENGGKPGHDPELERGEVIYAETKSAFESRLSRREKDVRDLYGGIDPAKPKPKE
jgi:hypothetical protein